MMRIDAQNFDDMLLDYVYDELDAEGRRAFEAYVAEHPEAQAALDELQSTRTAVAPLQADLTPSPITIRKVQVHAEEAAERMSAPRRPIWRRLLDPQYVPVVTILAVVIGLGVLRGGPPFVQRPNETYAPASADAEREEAPATPSLLADNRAGEDVKANKQAEQPQEQRLRASLDESKVASPKATSASETAWGYVDRSPSAPQDTLSRRVEPTAAEANAPATVIPERARIQQQSAAPGASSGGRVDAVAQSKNEALTLADADGFAQSVDQHSQAYRLNALAYQGPASLSEGVSFFGKKDDTQPHAVLRGEAEQQSVAAEPQGTKEAQKAAYATEAPAEETTTGDTGAGMDNARDIASAEEAEADDYSEVSDSRFAAADGPADPNIKGKADPVAAEFYRGRQKRQAGAPAEALPHLQNVVAWAPASPIAVDAQYETALALEDLGDCPTAILAYDDILDNAPQYRLRGEVLLKQAACLEQQRNYMRASQNYGQYQIENPQQRLRAQPGLERTNANLATQQ